MTHSLLRIGLIALGIALGVSGCGTTVLQSKKIDYKSQAKKTNPLEVPPDLTAPTQDERYAVPDDQGKGAATYSVYSKDREAPSRVSDTNILPQGNKKVHMERAGTQRWLVVNASAEEVWPTVKEFWNELGFIVNVERPEAGVMETDWAENRANIPQGGLRKWVGKVLDGAYSTPERDKFRTRVERSGDATTEIYVSHRGMYEIYVGEGQRQTKWQPRPSDPDLEAEILARLMSKFGADESRVQAELAPKPADRARLPRGAAELTVVDNFDRAWRRVGLALDRVGFTVEDRDRSKGTYFVRYVDPTKEEKTERTGLLSRLKFWRSAPKAQQGAQYRIQLAQAGEETKVVVQNQAGVAERTDAANKILGLLYDQLK